MHKPSKLRIGVRVPVGTPVKKMRDTQMSYGLDYKYATKNEIKAYEIPYDEAHEAAYGLCAPVTAYEYNPENSTERFEEYVLAIKAENREQTVPIDLKISDTQYFSGTTMGKQFTIRLIFKMGDNITVAARLEDWKTGGVIEGTFDEI